MFYNIYMSHFKVIHSFIKLKIVTFGKNNGGH